MQHKAQNSAQPVTRWKVVCAYDGSRFSGWQSQPGGQGIQDVIEARLAKIAGGLVRIHGSGRTDAGVHASGQVFHFDLPWAHGAEKLRLALRMGLGTGIQIKSVRRARDTFHARFQTTGKRYEYRLFLGDADPFTRPFVWAIERPEPLDFAAMERAAALLLGKHNFAAFSAYNGAERDDTVRDLRRLELVRRGRHVRIVAEADGFLYKMVRSLIGALIYVGTGRLSVERVGQLLRGGVRTGEVETAPPQGLFLTRVFYT